MNARPVGHRIARPGGLYGFGIFSHRDDVVLANPFGPAVNVWNKVSAALDLASSRFREGDVTAFERVATYRTNELACFQDVERGRAKVAGVHEIASFDLRVTSTYRREGEDWKLVHRHADTITTPQPADAVLRRWPAIGCQDVPSFLGARVAIATINSSGSIGFTRCMWNPLASDVIRSCERA